MTQVGGAGVADIGRGARAGEDDVGALGAAQGLRPLQEGGDGLGAVVIDLESVLPELGLLPDLASGDLGTHGLQGLRIDLEH